MIEQFKNLPRAYQCLTIAAAAVGIIAAPKLIANPNGNVFERLSARYSVALSDSLNTQESVNFQACQDMLLQWSRGEPLERTKIIGTRVGVCPFVLEQK